MDWTCGLDWWTGLVDWTGGLDLWTGLVDWTCWTDICNVKNHFCALMRFSCRFTHDACILVFINLDTQLSLFEFEVNNCS